MKGTWIAGIVLFFVVIGAAYLMATGSEEEKRSTPTPNIATQVYEGKVGTQAALGTPTDEPALPVETAVKESLEAIFDPSATATKLPTNTRVPTNTPVPGIGTQVYQGVVGTQAALGTPTDEPGLPIEAIVEASVEALFTPTSTHTATATALPTQTVRPSNTSVPGFGTSVHQGVIATQQAAGTPTFTPGPELATAIQAAVEATIYAPLTPSPTPQ